MKSNDGLVFGAATILSGFAGVFCDQGYWQRVSGPFSRHNSKPELIPVLFLLLLFFFWILIVLCRLSQATRHQPPRPTCVFAVKGPFNFLHTSCRADRPCLARFRCSAVCLGMCQDSRHLIIFKSNLRNKPANFKLISILYCVSGLPSPLPSPAVSDWQHGLYRLMCVPHPSFKLEALGLKPHRQF